MSIQIYIPIDSSALSVGAEEVADKIAAEAADHELDITIIRNGSRGLYWLEPMVEVVTDKGRIAYGPILPEDVESLFDADFANGSDQHPLYLGLTEEIPYLKIQQRLTFSRVGITSPTSLEDYLSLGGFVGLKNALAMTPQAIVDEVKASGLRGRGGAAFPTGIKWQTVLDTDINTNTGRDTEQATEKKYIVCNADEGDSGTFADRMLMEGDPYCLIEGIIIAGLAVGATQGYVYLRSEYPHAQQTLNAAIELAVEAGYLGDDVCGSGNPFDLEVRLGAGSYICGEETALLESLEGKRGMVQYKPPLPAIKGLFSQPTIVNNVITLASIPVIFEKGADHYKDFGQGRSLGTLPIQLAGNIKHAGLVELAFGITLRELLVDIGGGARTGRPIKAVQVGGPLGAYLPESQWDTPLDYEAFSAISAVLGHGGVVVFDDTVDMSEQARFAMEFCAVESCGKCTPCRIGSVRGVETIDKIRNDQNREDNLILLHDLCDTMETSSLCALGGMTPFPVRSAVNHFSEDFQCEGK